MVSICEPLGPFRFRLYHRHFFVFSIEIQEIEIEEGELALKL